MFVVCPKAYPDTNLTEDARQIARPAGESAGLRDDAHHGWGTAEAVPSRSLRMRTRLHHWSNSVGDSASEHSRARAPSASLRAGPRHTELSSQNGKKENFCTCGMLASVELCVHRQMEWEKWARPGRAAFLLGSGRNLGAEMSAEHGWGQKFHEK